MILANQHTRLRAIRHSDLEQLRTWRNRDSVNRYLVARQHIRADEQEAWFRSLDYSEIIYFMMEERSVAAGVIFARGIDLAAKSFEGGIFTGSDTHAGSPLPVKASLMLSLFFFIHLGFEYALSKVHCENTAALQLDRRLGFKELQREGEFITARCDKRDFLSHTGRLRSYLLNNKGVEITEEEGDERFSFLRAAAGRGSVAGKLPDTPDYACTIIHS